MWSCTARWQLNHQTSLRWGAPGSFASRSLECWTWAEVASWAGREEGHTAEKKAAPVFKNEKEAKEASLKQQHTKLLEKVLLRKNCLMLGNKM